LEAYKLNMGNIMICALCKSQIDEDSFYCDQCGKEIFICPKCNAPRKGKVCIQCGIPLVSMKSKTEVSSTQPTDLKQPISEIGELHLINKTLKLDIKITKDVFIGRTEGDFVDIFGKYLQISGRHLQINYDPQRQTWTATDLGSTNGTMYNNLPLQPNQPYILSDGSFLIIGKTIEFYVQIISKAMPDKTGTVRV